VKEDVNVEYKQGRTNNLFDKDECDIENYQS
jgi:hypothetical protein